MKTGVIPHNAIELSPGITFSRVFVNMTLSFSHDVTKLVKIKWKIRSKLSWRYACEKQIFIKDAVHTQGHLVVSHSDSLLYFLFNRNIPKGVYRVSIVKRPLFFDLTVSFRFLRFHKVKCLNLYEWVLKISWHSQWRHSDVTKWDIFHDFQYFCWKWPVSLWFSAQLEKSEVVDKFYTLWVYKPIITTSSMKIFILSTTSLYTN